MKAIYALLLSTFLAAGAAAPAANAQLLPPGQSNQPQELDGIVCVVDDGVILQSELDQALQTVLSQYKGDPSQLPPRSVMAHQVLQRLILQRLQVDRAHAMGIRITNAEVDRAVQGVASQNQITTDQLRRALDQRGISFASFRDQIADQLLIQKLRQQVLRSEVTVTDAEVDNLLKSPSFSAGEVHLQHIAINVPEGASPEDVDAAKAKAAKVEAALQSGADFGATAIEYSDAPDALEGGDLGWRRLDELPSAFVQIIANMQPGEVSPAVRGPAGFHIIKLAGRRATPRTVVKEYHALHLMVQPTLLLSDSQAKQKIEELRQKIVSGKADFKEVAKKDSDDDTTANEGGDMGWFPIGAWGDAIAEQIKQMKNGEVSQPFEAGGSWHIVKLLAERQQDRTAEVERQQAHDAIASRKSQDVYTDFLRTLRSRAYIDNRLDPDASSGTS
ncbi:MAG TPA: peptidylprolyl isomerase [Rhodanobacteraceae bacterium]|nr:peptidylprolyl isomerase [Rhodanobacteraceae bacterium]